MAASNRGMNGDSAGITDTELACDTDFFSFIVHCTAANPTLSSSSSKTPSVHCLYREFKAIITGGELS